MELKRKYAYCEACERFSYRIPGHRHEDGRVDSEESPVWLLTDRETIESDGIDPDEVPTVACCGVMLTEEAIVERLRAAVADPARCREMVGELARRLEAQLAMKERDIHALATEIREEDPSLSREEALHQARWRYADQGRRAGVHLQCRTPPDAPTLGWFERPRA